MTKQQMRKLIAKARQEGIRRHLKIKVLEYEIKFGDIVLEMSFSIN